MCIVSVNNDRIAGRIKPVHSVVGVLSTSVRTEIKWNGNSYRHVSELGMPYSRFNGIGGNFGAMLFVDVCNIFRDPDADEFDGNNYDFTFTKSSARCLRSTPPRSSRNPTAASLCPRSAP